MLLEYDLMTLWVMTVMAWPAKPNQIEPIFF